MVGYVNSVVLWRVKEMQRRSDIAIISHYFDISIISCLL